MDCRSLYLSVLVALVLPSVITAQYVYVPNDIDLIEKLNVKEEKIRYSERLGDTSVFETNVYDEFANLIEYKSKENMPIQARIIFHYDEKNFNYKIDYYRNHIFYQYKEIVESKSKKTERFYSVTGKYKGLQQTTFYNDKGQEEKIVIKRKGHPKLTKKFFYHENGNLKQIWMKKEGKPMISNFDEEGNKIGGEEKLVVPKKILAYHPGQQARIEMRTYTVSDILPEEIVRIGSGYQEEYEMNMYTYFLPNGLNERTEICIEDHLMYTYFFEYSFHHNGKNTPVSDGNTSSSK